MKVHLVFEIDALFPIFRYRLSFNLTLCKLNDLPDFWMHKTSTAFTKSLLFRRIKRSMIFFNLLLTFLFVNNVILQNKSKGTSRSKSFFSKILAESFPDAKHPKVMQDLFKYYFKDSWAQYLKDQEDASVYWNNIK